MSERQFQVRSIGTQDLTFRVECTHADVQSVLRNSQAIFRLVGFRANQTPEGKWGMEVVFTPDNGMVTVTDQPFQNNPISGK